MAKKIKKKLDLKKVTKRGKPRKRAPQKRVSNIADIPKGTLVNEFIPLADYEVIVGKRKAFENPLQLMIKANEYFQWCKSHPLYEEKAFQADGKIHRYQFPKVRAMTIKGLCIYMGVNEDYIRSFKNQGRIDGELYSPVINYIERVIYTQKFEAAASDLMNANIISRDLGLADSQKLDITADRKAVADLFPTELDEDLK